MQSVESKKRGLSPAQIEESREKYGRNVLTPPEKKSVWGLLWEKFKDPIVKVLMVALFLSFLVSCYQFFYTNEGGVVFFEPIGILVAVILSTTVGFLFERSANKKFEVLNQVNDEVCGKVVRRKNEDEEEGSVMEIPRSEVVVGDLIILETGDEIPADALLLESVSLQLNESTLTGEPLVKKTSNESELDPEATYPSNRVYKGTGVVDGHSIAIVEYVGDNTEYGKVYTGSQIENNIETPLNKQLKRLSFLITNVSYIIAALIIIGRFLMFFFGPMAHIDHTFVEIIKFAISTFMIAVTVIVVTVPEGLPMSVTLSLALSMKRMLASHNLVRKMHACETMGACTVICTDKTGTLTQNQMRIYETRLYPFTPESETDVHLKLGVDEFSRIIKESIATNTTAFLDMTDVAKPRVMGNPTDGALLLWLHEQGEDYSHIRRAVNIREQLTFSTERKYMATVVDSHLCPGKRLLFVKGAPEIVLSLCNSVIVNGEHKKVDECEGFVNDTLLAYQSKAMRTLGFAYMVIEEHPFKTEASECNVIGDVSKITKGEEKKSEFFENGRIKPGLPLCFLGFVAISDPVRADVPDAINGCLEAGIDIKIVTGDTPGTATEIGRQIGLWKPEHTDKNRITGPEFAMLSDEDLLNRVLDLKIISRARPMDKERLVKALQSKGQVVAVTGDGTNDAPALNVAQVGLSMGDGTSVAKEASDITILDNSFTSINKAVMWGRSLYRNVQRFIIFQMTINVVACLVVLIGAFMGAESPLTVTQMLWVNLIMDTFAAMALASLPPTMDVMKEKPRKVSEHIITSQMAKSILGVGFVFLLVLFGLMQYFKYEDVTCFSSFCFNDFLHNYFRFENSPTFGFSTYEKSLFFTTFVMLQFWNMFNAKSYKSNSSAFKDIQTCLGGFVAVALLIVVGQWVIITIGGSMFSVEPLKTADWWYIIGFTSIVLWIGEIIRIPKWLFKAKV